MKIKHGPEKGLILVGALITLSFFLMVSVAIAGFSTSQFVSTKRSLQAFEALSLAEAGAEHFMANINQVTGYTGSGGPVTFFNDDIRGKGTYETSIANGTLNNEKIVTSVGKIYQPRTSTTPKVTRKVKLTIRGTEPFIYSVQGGNSGPIYFYGSTNFSSGTIFTNRYIRLQDNSVSIKGTFKAVDKDPNIGSANCGISGGANSTSLQAGSIVDVKYLVTPSACNIGTTGSTVTENSGLAAQPLPTIDRDGILAGITTNQACSTITNAPYEIKKAHYPNNTPANGVDTGNSCSDFTLKKGETYTLKGNTHIRGNLTTDTNLIQVDSSVTSDVYVLVEGTITIKGNGSAVASNANNVSVIFVSYSTIDSAGDKNQPNAITISGNSLSLIAKFLSINGSLGMNGKGTIGAIAGAQAVVINGAGTINFIDAGSVPLNPNLWDVRIYQQDFSP
jgi:hypothetical protein